MKHKRKQKKKERAKGQKTIERTNISISVINCQLIEAQSSWLYVQKNKTETKIQDSANYNSLTLDKKDTQLKLTEKDVQCKQGPKKSSCELMCIRQNGLYVKNCHQNISQTIQKSI